MSLYAIESQLPVSSRLIRKIDPVELFRRRRAARTIERWAIKTFLRVTRTKRVTYATWCRKVHGPYVSRSRSELVVTPFYLGLENGPSVVRTTYRYLDETNRLAKASTEAGELLPGYLTSEVYLRAWSLVIGRI